MHISSVYTFISSGNFSLLKYLLIFIVLPMADSFNRHLIICEIHMKSVFIGITPKYMYHVWQLTAGQESAGWENPTLRNTPAVQWLVASTERFHLRALLTLGDAIHTERKDHEEHYSVITVSVLSLSLKGVFSSLPVFHHSDNKLF